MSISTEQPSIYDNLECMTVRDLLININKEDHTVPNAVEKCLPQIENFINALVPRVGEGGRLIYIGSGTSGRLGVMDASECSVTYGVSDDVVVGLISGGDYALRHSQESAEDDLIQGWNDLRKININLRDTVLGISASGSTPYAVGALESAKNNNILTGCLTCNVNSKLSVVAEHPIEVVVGPEFVTGSTRMKSGTAQKMILNMISTSLMIKMGHVRGNKMIDMKLSCCKLLDRGARIVIDELKISYDEAYELIQKNGSVRKAIAVYNDKNELPV